MVFCATGLHTSDDDEDPIGKDYTAVDEEA
jgi:hypothetical protein